MTRQAYRSLLFIPGHRQSMIAKARTMIADAVVFDLEDSVPASEKESARSLVAETLSNWPDDGVPAAFVRINSPQMGLITDDLGVLAESPHAGIIVPKVDLPIELAAVLDRVGRTEREVLVNVETPRSLLRAEAFGDTPGITGLFLGAEDLTHSLGMRRTLGGDELSWPRFLVLAAARAAGIDAYDTIHPDFRDIDSLRVDCERAVSYGFDGKFAIHPAQLPIINRAFTPSEAEIEHASRIVEAFEAAVERGDGAVAVDGQMVDPPVAERARAVLRRAEARASTS